jgi:hypothetical protein
MPSFGWIGGTHYSPHLSDAQDATFSCLLGMPWASVTGNWDGSPPPKLSQIECGPLKPWLAPWADARLQWRLFEGPDANGNWNPVNAAQAVTLVPDISRTETADLVSQAVKRLDAYVFGHADALGFADGGVNGTSLTYPIVAPGLAQQPALLSDSILGTTTVLRVARTKVTGGNLVALPLFPLPTGLLEPSGKAKQVGGSAEYEFEYAGPVIQAGGETFRFSGYVTRPVLDWSGTGQESFPGVPELRIRLLDRQVYAELTRWFWPLRVWMSSPEMPGCTGAELRAGFARLAGCGQDEMDLDATVLRAIGSVFEWILEHSDYVVLFPVQHASDTRRHADTMLQLFDAALNRQPDVDALWSTFVSHLGLLGCKDLAAAANSVRVAAPSQQIAPSVLAAAHQLRDAFQIQGRTSHVIWAAWFAAVLPVVTTNPLSSDVIARLLQRVLEVQKQLDEKEVQVKEDPVIDDDVLRAMNGQIDYAYGFWEDVHAADNLVVALVKNKANFLAVLSKRIPNAANMIAAYDAGVAAIDLLMDPSKPQAEDSPLQIRYSTNTNTNTNQEDLRGCILAIRAGVPNAGGTPDWWFGAWISTFNVKPAKKDGGFGNVLNEAGSANPAVFIDSQGATNSDGLEEQVIPYDGTYLFAAPDAPPPKVDPTKPPVIAKPEMLRRTAPNDELPQLAYGMCYQAVSGTLDNAGAIRERTLRQQSHAKVAAGDMLGLPRPPADFPDAVWGTDTLTYLSRQPPRTPTFAFFDDCGVTSETRSFKVHGDELDADPAKGAAVHPFRVAVLYGGNKFRAQRDKQALRVRIPTATPDFVRRWLSAELFPNATRWVPGAHLSAAQLKALIKDAQPQESKSTEPAHPAVESVELTMRWFDDKGNKRLELTHTRKVKHLTGVNWNHGDSFAIELNRVSGSVAACTAVPVGDDFRMDVPTGFRAEIDIASIVPAGYLDGDAVRFEKRALVSAVASVGTANERPFVNRAGGGYVSRVPERLWIESLPETPDYFEFPADAFSMRKPTTVAQEQLLSLQLSSPAKGADWVVGARLDLRRWQWSGYPVTFPKEGDLEDWLPLYAGTTDSTPKLPEASFSTMAIPGQDWQLKSLVMDPLKLPSPRPASHYGFIVTPIPRFAALLTDEMQRLVKRSYVYSIVEGVSRRQRPQPPVWLEAIPLPHTTVTDEHAGLLQVSPGSLGVLRNPMYDTADTAAFGGIAERLELDVMAAWTEGLSEIGPNPIFHGSPSFGLPPGTPLIQPELRMEPPFGLGYDKVVGGRPAQTGVIVRPVNSQGKWLLAKCRLRRFIIPDLMLDSAFMRDELKGSLDMRAVEDGWVPEDFSLHCSEPLHTLEIDKKKYTVNLPAIKGSKPAGMSLVYLVTWHRDRWAEAEITWRPLVNLYFAAADLSQWSLNTRQTPYSQAPFPIRGASGATLPFELDGVVTARHADVSEFTDSRWLHFIGSFGQEVVTPATALDVAYADGKFKVDASNGAMPTFGGKDDRIPSLLLVFAPQRDLLRGRVAQDGGELLGVYLASKVTPGKTVLFDQAILKAPSEKPRGASWRAVIMQVQKRNTDLVETLPTAWIDFVDALFPREGAPLEGDLSMHRHADEAKARLLPEYLGPINIQ